MLLRGRAACDAPRRWAQSAAVGFPHGSMEPSGPFVGVAPSRRTQATGLRPYTAYSDR